MSSARVITALDLESNPDLAAKLARVKSLQRATQLHAEATPSKPPGPYSYSSPLTDPQPLSKSTGAAAVAAAMEAPLLEQWPPSQLSKSTILSSSQDGRSDRATRVEARAEVRAQQEQEHQEREQAQAQMREVLASGLHGAGANIYETLKMEWVLQEDCVGSERSIGMAFTARLKAARLNFDGSTLARAIDCSEDSSDLCMRIETALVALVAVDDTDDTDGVIAFDDLIGHLGIADPAVKAQVETILEGMDTDFEASSILMYREGKIYCG